MALVCVYPPAHHQLAQDREYTFEPSSKFAIFTWYGCQLSVEGSPKVAYVSDDTPMNSYINTSNQINKMRVRIFIFLSMFDRAT